MTAPRQPRTCSHLINAQMLTGVCQAVRMFSISCICIQGTLESDVLSHVEPNGTSLVYLLRLYSTSAEGL